MMTLRSVEVVGSGAHSLRRAGGQPQRPRLEVLAGASAALAFVVLSSAHVHAQPADDWVGKRVVQKTSRLELRDLVGDPADPLVPPPPRAEGNLKHDEKVSSTVNVPTFYEVQDRKGDWLVIGPVGGGLVSRVRSADVLLAEGAIEFFSEQIRAQPKDAFSLSMRGMLRQDKNELDAAIADYTQAIQLDPKCALAYRGRGQIWYGKEGVRQSDCRSQHSVFHPGRRRSSRKDQVWKRRESTNSRTRYWDCNAAIRFGEPSA